MHLRSLALLVFIFAASAAVAGYVGIMYDQRALKSAAPAPAPTTEREVQSLNPPVESFSRPATPIGWTPETTQTSTLSSNSASQTNKPQDIQRPVDDSRKPDELPAVESARATASSNAVQRAKCNIQACENAYRSFDPADCTYLPANGPRRTCRK
jgi:hypothetical protein